MLAHEMAALFFSDYLHLLAGWLPPLLDRIARNFTTVVCPLIDVIDDDTLEYKYDQGSGDAVIHSIGVFDWTLTVIIINCCKRSYDQTL